MKYNLNNTFFLDLYPEYSNFEKKTILVVENRGIASYDVQNNIDDIVTFINNTIEKYENMLQYKGGYYYDNIGEHIVKKAKLKIRIPQSYTIKFKEFNDFSLELFITNIVGNIDSKNHKSNTNGSNEIIKNNSINNEKLNKVNIKINCDAINNKIVLKDFYETFNHEYNHAYEEYKRFLNKAKNNNIKNAEEVFNYYGVKNRNELLKSENEIEKSFGWVLYVLWNKGEFNSWTTSSYSYLKGIKSSRNNFSDDVKKCDGYSTYQYLKNNFIPEIKKCDNYLMWVSIYNMVSKNKIIDFSNKENFEKIKYFKERFIKISEKRLNRFWIKLCRNASLWYDELENNKLD